MGWDEYGSSAPNKDRKRILLAGGALAACVALLGFGLVAIGSRSGMDRFAKAVATTKVPESTTTTVADEPPSNDLDQYADSAAPNDVLDRMYGPGLTGTDPVLAQRIGELATRVIKAETTGEGREAFPDYFGNGRFTPTVKSMAVDYATGQKLSGSDMVRGVVVWHGTTVTGQVYKQVRRAIYFQPVGATYKPVPIDDLDADTTETDLLLLGQIIQ